MNNETKQILTRRSALSAATVVGSAAALSAAVSPREAEAQTDDDIKVAPDGQYERVPLRKDVIQVAAIQSRIKLPDVDNPKPVMRDNLNNMIDLIDATNTFISGNKDLLCFHEFPITGWMAGTREETLSKAIRVPGPETEAIGKKAKEYGCYIAFGSYVKDEENWPGHLMLNGILMGPDGEIAAHHWKQHNVRRSTRWTMYTTSVYDVLPRFVEMYGWDAVLPVARTDIGNLSLLISPYDPDIHRACSMKGMEIGIRFAAGGFNQIDSQASSLFNGNYTITVNQSFSEGRKGYADYAGDGGTSIYGPGGRVVAMAKSIHEEIITTSINMADFRRTHRLPDMPKAMVMPIFEKYQPPLDPGLSLEYIPDDLQDAARYMLEKRNW